MIDVPMTCCGVVDIFLFLLCHAIHTWDCVQMGILQCPVVIVEVSE